MTRRRGRLTCRSGRARRRFAGLVAAVLLPVLLAGCAGGGKSAAPTWVPQPGYTLEPNPVKPGATPGESPSPSDSGSSSPNASGPSASPSAAPDPAIVATGLTAPVGIAVLPDGTALVGQRTSGVIVRVQPVAGQPAATVRTIAGLDATGDGGLLDLAVSPAYPQDHLIYAYLTTATDNRVVDFTLTGPVTPVFTGIPKGATGNAGRIAFNVDGSLLIGTGNAGQPALAQDPASLAGKVLAISDVGQPVTPGSPVLAQGQHALAGLCVDPDTAAVFETEPSAAAGAGTSATTDEVNLLVKGADYGWPTPGPTSVAALAMLTPGPDGQAPVAAGCAVAGGVLYVASLDATSLYSADIVATGATPKLSDFTTTLSGKYGRLITVAADPADGSLWLATSNKTATGAAPNGASATDDERILHIRPSGGGAGSQA